MFEHNQTVLPFAATVEAPITMIRLSDGRRYSLSDRLTYVVQHAVTEAMGSSSKIYQTGEDCIRVALMQDDRKCIDLKLYMPAMSMLPDRVRQKILIHLRVGMERLRGASPDLQLPIIITLHEGVALVYTPVAASIDGEFAPA